MLFINIISMKTRNSNNISDTKGEIFLQNQHTPNLAQQAQILNL